MVNKNMLELNKNYFADCREVLKTIPDKSINLFLEDMPYNTTQCDWEYEVDLKEYWELRLPKLADKGVFVLTGSQPFTTDLIMSNRKMFKYEMVWLKSQATNFLNSKKQPLRRNENIIVFYPEQCKYFPIITKKDPKNIRAISLRDNSSDCYGEYKSVNHRSIPMDMSYPDNIIYAENQQENIHPTQKPIELFSYLIRTYTNENDLVFDGYSGSGTTAISCIRNNRKYIICENKKEYFDLQTNRILEEIDKTSLFNSLGGVTNYE